MSHASHPFAGFDGAFADRRSDKPRTTGRTMVIDWGMPLGQQRDVTATGAAYFDFAKIAVGVSRLLTRDLLTAKIDQYRSHQVEPFPGGQFLEYAEVHGLREREVGRKEGLENTIPLVDNARACMDAGASILLVEAAELVSDDAQTAADVDEIVRVVGIDRVMFELPGPWIADVHACDVHAMRRQLIGRYGPDVNIGNVAADELISVEAYRRGLGVNAGG